MKLKSILVKGPVDKTLTYKLCHCDPSVKRGLWEIAISSVSFYFTSDTNKLVRLSSNYVLGQEANEKGEIVTVSSTLSVVLCSGKKGTRTSLQLPSQNFFEINALHDVLELDFTNAYSGKSIKGANAYVFLLLRQKA